MDATAGLYFSGGDLYKERSENTPIILFFELQANIQRQLRRKTLQQGESK